jgi:hypothetical protein
MVLVLPLYLSGNPMRYTLRQIMRGRRCNEYAAARTSERPTERSDVGPPSVRPPARALIDQSNLFEQARTLEGPKGLQPNERFEVLFVNEKSESFLKIVIRDKILIISYLILIYMFINE